jgi:hypothetical protein
MKRVILGMAIAGAMGVGLVGGMLLSPARAEPPIVKGPLEGQACNCNGGGQRYHVSYGTVGDPPKHVAIMVDGETGNAWMKTSTDTVNWGRLVK